MRGGKAKVEPTSRPGNPRLDPAFALLVDPASAAVPRRAARPWLTPLVPLYAAALRWKNARYDQREVTIRQLSWPVVSVGSISAGGAGKTPFLIALAGLLRGLGYAPDVLSRGYGRRTRGVLRVDPNGTADAFGDESLMLARTLGCPVFVAAERFAAGTLAESQLPQTGRGIHLLDDGFSHRRLARTLNLVLLTGAELHDTLLPAGTLREPLESLRRADMFVLRASEAALLQPALERLLGKNHGKPVWTISRHLTLPLALPAHPFIFSGIARPADFTRSLRERGIEPAGTHAFRDHHKYNAKDAALIITRARLAGADGFLTTSKDAVKLAGEFREELQKLGPLTVVDAAVQIHDAEACSGYLRDRLARHSPFR